MSRAPPGFPAGGGGSEAQLAAAPPPPRLATADEAVGWGFGCRQWHGRPSTSFPCELVLLAPAVWRAQGLLGCRWLPGLPPIAACHVDMLHAAWCCACHSRRRTPGQIQARR